MKEKYSDLIKLIEKAQGDKTLNQFALGAGVNAGHLSRILNGNFKNPPTPETLKKIAKNSHGRVSYNDLLKASGYIDSEDPIVIENIEEDEITKLTNLVKNEKVKFLFDKIGTLDDQELDQVADIVNIVQKIDKNEKK